MPRVLASFAIIGSLGFAIEAIVLTLATTLLEWSPWQGRIPSFLTAVLMTWWLNRRHTFPGRGLQRRTVDALLYTGIQICGAAINLAIFAVLLIHVPELRQIPVIPLGVGAVGGFAFNFAASNFLLYTRSRIDTGK